MFDRLAVLTHGLRIRVKALLHGLEQMLVLHRVIRRSGPVVHWRLSEHPDTPLSSSAAASCRLLRSYNDTEAQAPDPMMLDIGLNEPWYCSAFARLGPCPEHVWWQPPTRNKTYDESVAAFLVDSSARQRLGPPRA
jgi:hypothetical protein